MSVLWVYALTGIALGIHTHMAGLRGASERTIAAHTCGDHELHLPLESLDACAICAISGHAPALLSDLPLRGYRTSFRILPAPAPPDESTGVDILSSGKRGPPAV